MRKQQSKPDSARARETKGGSATPSRQGKSIERFGNRALGSMFAATGAEAEASRFSQSDSVRIEQAPQSNAPVDAPLLSASIRALTGGVPLGSGLRSDFEARLGVPLDGVRLHTGPGAQHASARLQADAFTYGSDIAFGQDRYRPDTQAGRTLLAHELAHVAQQRQGSPVIQRQPKPPAPGEPDWYQRAAAFSSGMEVIQRLLAVVTAEVEDEQDDWYVFSDRTFTRPVVERIVNDGEAFRNHVNDFLAQTPSDEPLRPQIEGDLAAYTAALERLRSVMPGDIGTAESAGRHVVGGVEGAAGSFLGFLRLGLWDSWGEFIFDGSEERIHEAREGMMNLMLEVDEEGLGSTISSGASGWAERLEASENDQHYITGGRQFGGTAFDIYFAGRGLVSMGRGLSSMSGAAQALRAMGNPAPWRAALGIAAREAVTFRGLGVTGGRGLLGSSYGLAQTGETVRIIRIIAADQDLIAKTFKEPATSIVNQNGAFRPLSDVARAHASSSSGSPFQSGYPMADVETAIAGNPQNFGVASGPYVVVLEVPAAQAEGLVSVNDLVVTRAGLNPADFPEFSTNRFGMSLPEEMRPATTEGYQLEQFSPEAQQWLNDRLDFGSSSRPAVDALDGVPYREWEQVVLAPSLRPYVVDIRANPFGRGTANPLTTPAGQPSFFNPAMNPVESAALARAGPGGWPRFQQYTNWLSSQSAAGSLGFTPEQISGFNRVTLLGGSVPEVPLPALTPGTQDREPSLGQLQAYMRWMGGNASIPQGMMDTAQASVAQSQIARFFPVLPGALPDASHDFSTIANLLRGDGVRVTEFRVGAGSIFLQAHVTDLAQAESSIAMIAAFWRQQPDITAGVVLVVDEEASLGIGRDLLAGYAFRDNFRLTVQTASGRILYRR